jgi:hypothetical protein
MDVNVEEKTLKGVFVRNNERGCQKLIGGEV